MGIENSSKGDFQISKIIDEEDFFGWLGRIYFFQISKILPNLFFFRRQIFRTQDFSDIKNYFFENWKFLSAIIFFRVMKSLGRIFFQISEILPGELFLGFRIFLGAGSFLSKLFF